MLNAVATDEGYVADPYPLYIGASPPTISEGAINLEDPALRSIVLREPNAALALYLLGYRRAQCRDSSLTGTIKLFSPGGYTIELRSCSRENLIASSPLLPPPLSFKDINITYGEEVFEAIRELTAITGNNTGEQTGETWYTVSDTYLIDRSSFAINACRPGIGCTKWSKITILDPGETFKTSVLHPVIQHPLLLATWTRRITRSRGLVVRAPWMCVKTPLNSFMFLCSDGVCVYTITREGVVESDNESFVYSSCSPYIAFNIHYLGTHIPAEAKKVFSPLLISCPAIPLAAKTKREESRIFFDLALWNPLSRTIECEIYVRELRLVQAYLYTFYTFSWERLLPVYNYVRFMLNKFELAYTRLELEHKGRYGRLLRKRI